MNQDDKTMLALASLTYRGFGLHSEEAVDRALRPWLPKLEPLGLGRWELVWGPATFRVETSLVDDSMMYVARRQDLPAGTPAHYAVAIRGTNPVSVFDWVFGDFWVQLQIDQPPAAAPPATLSASTALGVAILQHLAAEVPPSKTNRLAPFATDLANTLREFATSLPELDPAHLLRAPATFGDLDLKRRIDALTGAAGKEVGTRLFDRLRSRFADATRAVQAVDRHVFDGLVRHIENTGGQGESLLQFLNRVVVEKGARVSVTGHSKGGALAVAAAFWLAESWAPARGAAIECFSFAGPTAGNAAFVKRYDQRLNAKTRRIVNRRDLVPQAFVPATLEGLGTIYPELALSLKALAKSVGKLGYEHVGGALVEFPSKKKPGGLIQDIIYQHLDAYLAEAGFPGPEWTVSNLFRT